MGTNWVNPKWEAAAGRALRQANMKPVKKILARIGLNSVKPNCASYADTIMNPTPYVRARAVAVVREIASIPHLGAGACAVGLSLVSAMRSDHIALA